MAAKGILCAMVESKCGRLYQVRLSAILMLPMSESVTLEGYAEFQTWSILECGLSAEPKVINLAFNRGRAEGDC